MLLHALCGKEQKALNIDSKKQNVGISSKLHKKSNTIEGFCRLKEKTGKFANVVKSLHFVLKLSFSSYLPPSTALAKKRMR